VLVEVPADEAEVSTHHTTGTEFCGENSKTIGGHIVGLDIDGTSAGISSQNGHLQAYGLVGQGGSAGVSGNALIIDCLWGLGRHLKG
jgi:hypothetical protein